VRNPTCLFGVENKDFLKNNKTLGGEKEHVITDPSVRFSRQASAAGVRLSVMLEMFCHIA